MTNRTTYIISVLLISMSLLSACAGIVAGGAAAVGVAAVKEGGLKASASDLRIQTQINDLWLRHDFDIFKKLDLTVNQGRVLITGIVQNPEHRVDAVRLTWKVSGVKQVINEIKIAEGTGVTGYLSDAWISAKIRTGITVDKDVQNLNYTIDTVAGVVYLMGVAQSRDELNRVVERSRTTNGVNRVVSYVKIAGEEIGDSTAMQRSSYDNGAKIAAPVSSPIYDSDPMVNIEPAAGGFEDYGDDESVGADPIPLY